MQLKINGQMYEVADGDAYRPVLWVLRDELGLTGTKYGCGAGICGACTIHVDGVATRSCQMPVSSVAGAELVTIEGLTPSEAETLHPVQRAFLEEQVPQCSWCMSGQMMTAAAFLGTHAAPTAEDLFEAMNQNYCRCGCYVRIRRAVVKAAGYMAEERGV